MSKLMNIGSLIDTSWEHYREHFGDLLRISAWTTIFLLIHVIAVSFYPLGLEGSERLLTGSETFGFILFLVNSLVVGPVIGLWVVTALILAIDKQASGKAVKMHVLSLEAWKLFLPHLWVRIVLAVLYGLSMIAPVAVLWAISRYVSTILPYMLTMLLMFASLLLFLIPLMLLVHWAFAQFNVVLANERGITAVNNSWKMTKGRFFEVASRLIIPKVLYFIVLLLVQMFLLLVVRVIMFTFAGDDGQIAARVEWIVLSASYIIPLIFINPLIFVTDYLIFKGLKS